MPTQRRKLFQILALLSLCLPANVNAQVKQIIEGPDKPWTYEFVVDPAPEMQPALKYRLLPDRMTLKPGNAATSYYRAIQLFNAHPEADRKEFEECHDFGLMIRPKSTKPDGKSVEPIAIERVHTLITKFADVFAELKIATHFENCDWGIGYREKDAFETMNLGFQEFFTARSLCRLLQLKARVAIVNGDYAEAFQFIQMSFQYGQDITRCPFIISNLIGTAICIETQVLLAEIIAHPGSPNLYWALASSPRPFVDLHASLENELNLVFKFPIIREAEQPHTPEEWKQLFLDAAKTTQQLASGKSPTDSADQTSPEGFLELVKPEYPRIKEELVQFGYTAEQISAMPIIQVIALHEAALARHKRDETLKLIYLPIQQASPLLEAIERPADQATKSRGLSSFKEAVPLFERLRPAVKRPLEATARLERLLVRSQTIEAIRLYAAANNHRLPSSLSDITLVPIPSDPATGLPIKYRLDGETAVLEFLSFTNIPSEGEFVRVTLRKPN